MSYKVDFYKDKAMLGPSIRMIRQAKGLRATQVAQAANISTAHLSLLENGEREASLAILKRIANALDVPLDTLILLGAGESSSLRAKSDRAQSLVRSLRNLANAEQRLAKHLSQRKPEN